MSKAPTKKTAERLTTTFPDVPERGARSFPLRELLLGLILIGLTAIAYAPALRGGFIWDDDMHLTKNPCIVGPLGLKDVWTTRAARICPLVQTTFWAEHEVWGLNPFPYHVVNVLVQIGCALVLWRVLNSLRIPGAWLGAALWAVHPVQVETVAWITELKNTQSCLFYLLAVLFFVKSEISRNPNAPRRAHYFYSASLLCALFAMASKSSTVVLPAVLGLSLWWINRRWQWRDLTKLVPFFFMSIAASILSFWTQHLEGANQAEYARTWAERIAIAGKVVWFYLAKLAWPHPLIFIYPRWEVDPARAMSYLATVSAGVLLFVCWRNRHGKLRSVFFAFAYFLVALFPVLGLFDHYFLRYSFVGDHFQYLASIGPLALAGSGIILGLGLVRKGIQYLGPVLCAALLLELTSLSYQQCRIYVSSESLWRATISQNLDCWMALNNLGVLLLKENHPDEAMTYCERAIQLRPNHAELHVTMGNALLAKQLPDEAIRQYRVALGLRLDDREELRNKVHYNLGNALLQTGQIDQAIEEYQKALQYRSYYAADVLNNLGDALLRKGEVDDAISYYRQAVQFRAGQEAVERAVAQYNLANALVVKGQTVEAIACFQQALALRPDYAEAHNNLGRVFLTKNDFANGIAHYQRALEIAPNSALYQNNLAWQLATCPNSSLRNGAKAVELAKQAGQLSGDNDPIILNTLAAAYAEDRQFSRAAETAREALRLAGPGGDPGLVQVLRHALALYQAGLPYDAEGH